MKITSVRTRIVQLREDALRIEQIHAKLHAAANYSGPAGLFTLALSAIDMALWDIKGKALGQPLWKLLGGARERVPTYASGALMRGLTLDQSIESAGRLAARGWREVKMQLALPGETSPEREVERARRVRDALDPKIKLMADINQRWRPEHASATRSPRRSPAASTSGASHLSAT